jgi:hypothetical protein
MEPSSKFTETIRITICESSRQTLSPLKVFAVMNHRLCLLVAAIGIAVLPSLSLAADHGHLNVGSVGTAQNDPLDFDNGDIFATDSGYLFTLVYTNGFTYAGYYQGNITLTVLAGTSAHSGPVPGAPALGSYIFAQIVSVEGPTGGTFSFWDSGATNPTISIATGTTNTNLYLLTESDGSPGTDPYGHFHGRRFTATLPGLYTVTFRALDLSTNGVGGGSIHTPSSLLKIYFQAGVTITSMQKTNDVANLVFGARLNRTYTLQAATNISNPNGWMDIGEPVVGNDALTAVTDLNATNAARFYRIKDVTP